MNSKNQKSNLSPYVFIVPIVLSLIFVIVGILLINKNLDFIKTAEKANGIVIEKNKSVSTSENHVYYLTIKYITQDNQIQVAKTDLAYTSFVSPKVNQNVAIYYDPQDPTKIKIDSIFSIWGFPIFFVILGLILIFISINSFIKLANTKHQAIK